MKYIKLFESFNHEIKIVSRTEFKKFKYDRRREDYTKKDLKILDEIIQLSGNYIYKIGASFPTNHTFSSSFNVDDIKFYSFGISIIKFVDEYYTIEIRMGFSGEYYYIVDSMEDLKLFIDIIIKGYISNKNIRDILKLL